MRVRMLVAAVALWLGVVAVGSGLTWLVIDQVGRGVVSGQEEGATGPVAGTSAPSAAPSARAGDTPAATVPGPTPRTRTTSTPAVDPPRSTPANPTRTVTRTWSGTGGHVTVSCDGARVELGSASPDDGWRVEIGSRGPEEVEVEFKQGGEGAESHVQARCSAGEPRFDVEQDD